MLVASQNRVNQVGVRPCFRCTADEASRLKVPWTRLQTRRGKSVLRPETPVWAACCWLCCREVKRLTLNWDHVWWNLDEWRCLTPSYIKAVVLGGGGIVSESLEPLVKSTQFKVSWIQCWDGALALTVGPISLGDDEGLWVWGWAFLTPYSYPVL